MRQHVSGRIVLVGYAGLEIDNYEKISRYRDIAIERFGQMGIKPKLAITSIEAPEGLNMNNVSHDGGVGPDGILVHQDSKAIIDKARNEGKLATVTVFVVPSLNGEERGRAFRRASLASRNQAYANHVIISERAVVRDNSSFTIAHEIGHIITDQGHFGEQYAVQSPAHVISKNLMRNTTSELNGIAESKRLILSQQNLLRNDLLEDSQ